MRAMPHLLTSPILSESTGIQVSFLRFPVLNYGGIIPSADKPFSQISSTLSPAVSPTADKRADVTLNRFKEKMQSCRQRYDIYCDIEKTYSEISKHDYLTGLVEEEHKRREQIKKKKNSR